MTYDFRSDNVAPPRAEFLDAALRSCAGWMDAYGEDSITARVEDMFADIFEHEVVAFPILTGTAANALALAQISNRFGQILCHRSSHIYLDECGAVEFHNPGGRLKPLNGEGGKLDVDHCARALGVIDDVHQLRCTALSISQATEMGTYYSAGEVGKLAALAKKNGMAVHMDGTRFANVVAASEAAPAELTWQSGVDVLCLGATKGGAIGAEVVLFFDRHQAMDFKRLMKRSGHLPSRMWFLAAQLQACFQGGLWLESARHANAMAARLGAALETGHPIVPYHPVQTNMVFLKIDQATRDYLRQQGFDFYTVEDEKDGILARLVTSHATQPDDVDRLVDAIRCAVHNAA
ncbi:beta-eliminating lyase-related protein [Mesorhizobium sp. KR1-2]|uniref:threonine aldolase family protein n=1 Tax=Mesorhizobium sp. KR1-2 TaxID=3156609 RepID=UPI0032B4FC46